VEINYKADNAIQKLLIFIDSEKIQEIKINDEKS
jgi:hypothetical protein